jgi:MarR family transcriptional regulator, 2-MHQ and catechol-resistance regulon repressor
MHGEATVTMPEEATVTMGSEAAAPEPDGVAAAPEPDGVFDDPRLTAMGLLAETYAGLMAKSAPALTASGLSMTDFDVLLRLARSAGQRLRMTDLATQTALSTSGITRVVDRLEHRGLVVRESCPSDRRGAFAVITSGGQGLLTDVVQVHVKDIDRWFTGLLTETQLGALLGALRIVRDEVRPGATAGVCPPGDHGQE